MKYTSCGADVDATKPCQFCGSPARIPIMQEQYIIDPAYQAVFKRFDENGGKFMPTFNFFAFIFGAFWYLFKGMWVKAVIIFGITLFFSATSDSGALLLLLLWVYGIIAANYDYYRYIKSGQKQPFSDGTLSWW